MALFGEIIVDQCQTKRKENQDAKQLTETATLKINETNKIKELYKILGEFTVSEKEKQLKESQKVEEEWKEMEDINNLSKVNQIGQLEVLELKEKERNNYNLPKIRSEQILENGIIGMGEEIPKGGTKNKYGEAARRIEIGKIGKTVNFTRIPFSEAPEGDNKRRGICLRNGKKTNKKGTQSNRGLYR